MNDEAAAQRLDRKLRAEHIPTRVTGGTEAVRTAPLEESCCTVVAAISGACGLPPVLTAAQNGLRLLLANKEALVIAGELVMNTARANGAEVLPIDSEHAALFELLAGNDEFEKLWLTASGGALSKLPLNQFDTVSPAQVLAHPTWSMGPKITVDSATMMNKALEVIEASVLFSAASENIGVVLHPQSIVHALVEKNDGSLIAQLSSPDMRQPIARMLSWPDDNTGFRQSPPKWETLSSLTFAKPEATRYPCLQLARDALAIGGAAPAVLSAANEVAVTRFLRGDIKFTRIAHINTEALEQYAHHAATTLEDLWAADSSARLWAAEATA
jgi:1-deoxy-D-xylulose-5-phosphate reductoisomerase